MVVEEDPIKQGLKRICIDCLNEAIEVVEEDPIKQGLKHR